MTITPTPTPVGELLPESDEIQLVPDELEATDIAPHRSILRRLGRSLVATVVRDVWGLISIVVRLTWRLRAVLVIGAGYATVGWWLLDRIDLVVLDSLSRSAHASFVWHNGPPKLAALGFAWPPVATLPLLPLSAIRSLATTGMIAPIVTSLATAALLLVVRSELKRLGFGALAATAAVSLIAVNPMIVYYAANGMSEMWALLLPTLMLTSLIRWYDTDSMTPLAIASFAAALAVLARYELGILIAVMTIGVAMRIIRAERDFAKARAYVLFAAMPSIFAVGVWMYFNWTVQGSPIWFLNGGNQLSTIAGTASTIGASDEIMAMGRGASLAAAMHAQISFAPSLLLTIPLLSYLAIRKRAGAWMISAIALSGLVVPVVIILAAGNPWLAQLRFNMRTIPLAVIGLAWAVRELGLLRGQAGRMRRALAVSLLVLPLMAALPLSAERMANARVQFSEVSFIHSLRDRESLTGTVDQGGQSIGCANARSMGQWIEANIHRRDSILADDSSMFAVMLYSAHPERFLDRIDWSDAYFIDNLDRPMPSVQYVLSTDFSHCAGVRNDLISDRWPDLFATGNGGYLDLVHETSGFRLYRLTDRHIQRPEGEDR